MVSRQPMTIHSSTKTNSDYKHWPITESLGKIVHNVLTYVQATKNIDIFLMYFNKCVMNFQFIFYIDDLRYIHTKIKKNTKTF